MRPLLEQRAFQRPVIYTSKLCA